jgi:hypothetical protein
VERQGEGKEDVAEVLDDDATTTLAMNDYEAFAARLETFLQKDK